MEDEYKKYNDSKKCDCKLPSYKTTQNRVYFAEWLCDKCCIFLTKPPKDKAMEEEKIELTLSWYEEVDKDELWYSTKIHRFFKHKEYIKTVKNWERKIHVFIGTFNDWDKFVTKFQQLNPTACMFQLEEGSYPTSFIATSDCSTTREGDCISVGFNGKYNWSTHRGIIETDKDGNEYLLTEPTRTNHIIGQKLKDIK